MDNECIPGKEMNFDLSDSRRKAVKQGFACGLIPDHKSISLVDIDGLESTVKKLQNAFPDNFFHSFAVKSNYYLGVLKILEQCGMRAEVAGEVELELALKAGFPPERIVFDGPVKTREEIDRVLRLGIHINVDNFQELDVIASFLEGISTNSNIGFRINPQIGAGSVELSSTATLTSKFGVGLEDAGTRDRLLDAYAKYPWLNALHVHVGSVACPLSLMCEGVDTVFQLADEINQHISEKQIKWIDIGGGLPVDFTKESMDPSFEDYAKYLTEHIEKISTGEYFCITEFGRAIIAKNAMTLAYVEYTKTTGYRQIALTHAGAHNMMRIVFQPDTWARRINAISPQGNLKTDNITEQDIAGPCCFAGDIIGHQRKLPLLEVGDYVLIQDTGAYCFSNHFQYNALPSGAVYSYRSVDGDNLEFQQIRPAQTVSDVVNMYN